ncbi:ISC system 2Fe-2S type ferredoxin [Pseudomonas sp. SWI6]|jgi:ferredoxin, 2Fe-2S type, ISC system|uniref:2Fe-2S ferredoxin n=1 Tax=Pseudomonas taiwanensis TaxID=470150 RepID=A0ABR6V4B4_9PSED|nr:MULTISPECIES: ISC system 2Fe-2S type ferredoxin [Pseudomonas]AGZ36920.1 ferredoxin, 2Fe-2S type, ISC system [Pseudomonas sp. VLB120]AVD81720.1 ISC system 2Fe-2S type ferredoxin [Pseudomonas sp. SWI6]AVD88699.1 ISC system 2Fe-2S type ferredoxin [Pseudomonas sp. SWI44]MBC3475346.1 ISC system 2Fe-2S type ferredoxin [Pseudomonas taiwanensis]MBC3491164.1 ISC system 2Fe-2S type ferredoxin [Pseudomonas taiwanensis]
MPQVIFLPHEKFCPEGLVVEVEPGTNILELAHEHHIEMESACGGVCACTTCHCIVREGFDSLEEADELEEDMLDKAWGLEAQSRLACQVIVGEEDLTIEIPKYSLNHAAEAPH